MIGRVMLVMLLAGTSGGCFKATGPRVGVDWPARPTAVAAIRRPPDRGLLQVFTGYTPPVYSHAALRVQTVDGQVTFWDPGGDYAKTSAHRRHDDLVDHPPPIGEYLRWRLDVVGDRGGEVFEWDIQPQHAQRLADVLQHGATRADSQDDRFHADTVPSQCAIRICRFLRKFAPDQAQLTRNWFYPYKLAQALYRAGTPDRIIVYHRDRPVKVYYRPAADPSR
jgi:hypothetical protein